MKQFLHLWILLILILVPLKANGGDGVTPNLGLTLPEIVRPERDVFGVKTNNNWLTVDEAVGDLQNKTTGWINASDPDYTDINAAITACVNTTLIVGEAKTITGTGATLTVPAGCHVEFTGSGSINGGNDNSLTFASGSSINAPENHQIFVGFDAGDVTGLTSAYPEWWGIDGVADQEQFNLCLEAVKYSGGTCHAVAGKLYQLNGGITQGINTDMIMGMKLLGHDAKLNYTGTGDVITWGSDPSNTSCSSGTRVCGVYKTEISDFIIYADTARSGLWLRGKEHVGNRFSNIRFETSLLAGSNSNCVVLFPTLAGGMYDNVFDNIHCNYFSNSSFMVGAYEDGDGTISAYTTDATNPNQNKFTNCTTSYGKSGSTTSYGFFNAASDTITEGFTINGDIGNDSIDFRAYCDPADQDPCSSHNKISMNNDTGGDKKLKIDSGSVGSIYIVPYINTNNNALTELIDGNAVPKNIILGSENNGSMVLNRLRINNIMEPEITSGSYTPIQIGANALVSLATGITVNDLSADKTTSTPSIINAAGTPQTFIQTNLAGDITNFTDSSPRHILLVLFNTSNTTIKHMATTPGIKTNTGQDKKMPAGHIAMFILQGDFWYEIGGDLTNSDYDLNIPTGEITAQEFIGDLTGNAATCTTLAANPTDCVSPNIALGINADGTAVCTATPTVTGLTTTGDVTVGGTLGVATLQAGAFLESTESVTASGTNTITTAECGKTLILNHATVVISNVLPVPTAGCRFEFKIGTATTASHTITTNSGSNLIDGNLDIGNVSTLCENEDTITFDNALENVGDWVEIISEGTNWYIKGQGHSALSITCGAT